MLVVRSIAMIATYHLLYHVSYFQPCQPLTFDTFPMQTIAWLCYRFCSAPLIALLVAGEVKVVPCRNMDMLGYHNISDLINASIYFGKGWKARPYA